MARKGCKYREMATRLKKRCLELDEALQWGVDKTAINQSPDLAAVEHCKTLLEERAEAYAPPVPHAPRFVCTRLDRLEQVQEKASNLYSFLKHLEEPEIIASAQELRQAVADLTS